MSLPIEDLTPRQIVAALDRYIIGQHDAKKAVAVALRNRYRRQQVPEKEREEITPKNILMIGPTGVGKTEIARRLAQLAKAPMVKVEATKFTEVGYVGRDIESIIRDLVAVAVRLVEREKMEEVSAKAEEIARERLVDLVEEELRDDTSPSRSVADNPLMRHAMEIFGTMPGGEPEKAEAEEEQVEEETDDDRRKRIEKEVKDGVHDELLLEIDSDDQGMSFLQVFTPQGPEEMGFDMGGMMNPFGGRRSTRKVKVRDALEPLIEQEAGKLLDRGSLHREALERAEQTGIVFIDEIDKIAIKSGHGAGPDVSREGVQRDLLPIIEGSTVATKYGSLHTDHILFIAAGAFHQSKPSDLIPELQGRLPIRVELHSLSEEDFRRILHEPQNALTKQYQKLLAVEGVKLKFKESAFDALASLAAEVNSRTENIGARRLHTLMEKLLEDIMFDAPDDAPSSVVIDSKFVHEKLQNLVDDTDLSRYIL
ncbi:MAG: ATP-dependent protease ATPase subunit HslU [Armatimonadetes bacterium]|nr:ATP-dependent protease ATPase subunit HslU [Armatimonadota bacterium]